MKLNLPNKITLLRIFLALPLIGLGSAIFYLIENDANNNVLSYKNWSNENIALILFMIFGFIFIIAMFSDFLDGYLARKNNQVSEFGKLFDPLGDKIITGITLIFLLLFKFSFFWVFIIFFVRDLVVDGFRNVAAKNNIDVSASIYGKIKTLIQSFALPFIIFISPIFQDDNNFENLIVYLINIPLYISIIFSLMSGYLYIKEIYPYVKK